MSWVSVPVIIVPADADHVAIMHYTCEGEGDVLPDGAAWRAPGVWMRPPTPENIERQILRWRQLDAPNPALRRAAPLRWFVAKYEDVPVDREYRNAQVANGESVEHDMVKARELHRDKLRNERVERMLQLDNEWMAATRAKDQAAVDAVDAKKQVLLDITDDPRIDAAATIEDLKQITLPALE